jgi:exodeoxyribonuclease V alpha subunit
MITDVVVPEEVAGLRPFVEAGVFEAAEVQLAATVRRLCPGVVDEVVLAVAVAARGPRLGHVCVALDQVAEVVVDRSDDHVVDLAWPEVDGWARALAASEVVASPATYLDPPLRPLVWDGHRVYLQRYWHHEAAVADDLRARAAADLAPPGVSVEPATGDLVAALDSAFPPGEPQLSPRDVPFTPGEALSRSGEAPFFLPGDPGEPDLQRLAAQRALVEGVSIIAGGPGTGKTRTVARLIAAAARLAGGSGLEVVLAAPTGKAAARMTEAVRAALAEVTAEGGLDPKLAEELAVSGATTAVTLHRLLGWAPGASFRHSREDPLPQRLVIVDEASMVSLPLMAGLLAAVRPDARLVLVGDPHQLASVEAGSVLADVVGPVVDGLGWDGGSVARPVDGPGRAVDALDRAVDGRGRAVDGPLRDRITVLRRVHRFAAGSAIARLANAIRFGDADDAIDLLSTPDPAVTWVAETDRRGLADVERLVVDGAEAVARAALAGDADRGLEAATEVKVLAATRRGPGGLFDWSDRIEAAVAARVPTLARHKRWYVGRPIIVTANDAYNHVANGDVGLVVAGPAGPQVALAEGAGELRYLPPARLDRVETWWAMTIHKSQGSEFTHVVVSLPAAGSPILTRELLYTAVTRARQRVTVVGSESALRGGIERPVVRASGLRERLWAPAERWP